VTDTSWPERIGVKTESSGSVLCLTEMIYHQNKCPNVIGMWRSRFLSLILTSGTELAVFATTLRSPFAWNRFRNDENEESVACDGWTETTMSLEI